MEAIKERLNDNFQEYPVAGVKYLFRKPSAKTQKLKTPGPGLAF
jgi:hypothetical protein